MQLSIHLAAELASQHINVNVIALGVFPSKMTAGTIEQLVAEKVPRRRLWVAAKKRA